MGTEHRHPFVDSWRVQVVISAHEMRTTAARSNEFALLQVSQALLVKLHTVWSSNSAAV